ncbi:MAG: HAD family phosphatase [Oscillospiraceae bacterium]|nr:HAD family phosphatase [Oscillospiraceae bacterium]
MIRNVVFDIGKVLIRFDWEHYMETLFDDETTREKVTAAMWHNPDWNELDRGVLPFSEVVELLITKEPDYADAIRLAAERLGEAPDRQPYAIEWIDRLREMGFSVYYLSNYFEYLMDAAPHVLDFVPHTNGGIFSCHEKITKPDPEIYRRLFRKYNLKPEECLFIDDLQKNIDAAKALGMSGIRFDGYEASYPEIMAFLEQNKP